MKLNKILPLLALLIFISAADLFSAKKVPDTRGDDFWVTYMPNYHNNWNNTNPIVQKGDSLYLFIGATEATSGTIEYWDRFQVRHEENFTISDPGDLYVFKVSWWDYELRGTVHGLGESEVPIKQSFHITSDKDVTIYAHNQAETTSDAFNVMPTDALGKKYMILSYNSDDDTPSQFAIVATEDNTAIKIVPSFSTRKNDLNPQDFILMRGEAYLVEANVQVDRHGDMTGTEIESDKPIAVFSGQTRAAVPYNDDWDNPSRDCLMEQMLPVESWGNNVFLFPYRKPTGAMAEGEDLYRILAAFDNTEVYIDGNLNDVIDKGEFIEGQLTKAHEVVANKPVTVCQFKKSSKASGSSTKLGDPFMMYIPQTENFDDYYRFINIQAYEFEGAFTRVYQEHFITIITKISAKTTIRLDGNPVTGEQFTNIGSSGWAYAHIRVNEGVHTIQSADHL